MTKKFLVQIAFVVEETPEIRSESRLEHFIRENGGVSFTGNDHNDNYTNITDVYLGGNEVILSVTELD